MALLRTVHFDLTDENCEEIIRHVARSLYATTPAYYAPGDALSFEEYEKQLPDEAESVKLLAFVAIQTIASFSKNGGLPTEQLPIVPAMTEAEILAARLDEL